MKYYAKQVDPEFAEDNLFWNGKNGLEIMDEVYAENIIIKGNREYLSYYPEDLENLEKNIEYFIYDLDTGEKITSLVNYYFKKRNGKRWSKHELALWKKVAEEENLELALSLITGKEWRKVTLRGYSQSDWQGAYVSNEIKQNDLCYIEMCYFNTGLQYDFFNNKEEFDEDCPATSYYVSDKKELLKRIGCAPEEIEIYDFADYVKTAQYKLA